MDYPITTGRQKLTAAGVVPGTLNTEDLTIQGTLIVRVDGMTADKRARVAIEDTEIPTDPNAIPATDAFQDALPVAVMHLAGQAEPRTFTFSKHDLTAIRAGSNATQLRARVLQLDPGTDIYVQATYQV